MSVNLKRVRTLQAIVAGIRCIATDPKHQTIQDEFGEVYRVGKVRHTDRRRLLEVLHSTRALDTALSSFVRFHGCLPRPRGGRPSSPPNTLGGYLIALEEHSITGLGALTPAQTRHFQTVIVDRRNVYVHEAGAVPMGDPEVHVLLSEMDSCLMAVSRL